MLEVSFGRRDLSSNVKWNRSPRVVKEWSESVWYLERIRGRSRFEGHKWWIKRVKGMPCRASRALWYMFWVTQ